MYNALNSSILVNKLEKVIYIGIRGQLKVKYNMIEIKNTRMCFLSNKLKDKIILLNNVFLLCLHELVYAF